MSARKRHEYWNTCVDSAYRIGGADAAWALVETRKRRAACPVCTWNPTADVGGAVGLVDHLTLTDSGSRKRVTSMCPCCGGVGALLPGARVIVSAVTGRAPAKPNQQHIHARRYNTQITISYTDPKDPPAGPVAALEVAYADLEQRLLETMKR